MLPVMSQRSAQLDVLTSLAGSSPLNRGGVFTYDVRMVSTHGDEMPAQLFWPGYDREARS